MGTWTPVRAPTEEASPEASQQEEDDSPGGGEDVPLLCVYHKPLAVQSKMCDPRSRPCLSHVLGQQPASWQRGLHHVGRLDADTTGLLLFSSSGALTHRLLHPSFAVDKEYVASCSVRCEEAARPETLRVKLEAGVETKVGFHTARLVEARRDGDMLEVRLVVTEGKNRMVRRLLAALGLPVVHLRRDRLGAIRLGNIEVGAFEAVVDPEALAWARAILNKPARAPGS